MRDTWLKTHIEQVGKIITGKTPSTTNSDNFGGSVPFITPSDLDDRRFINVTARYLTDRGVQSVKNSRIPPGAVMVSCIGSDMGKVAIAVNESVTNQQINSILVNSDNEPLYIYYNLSGRKSEIRASASGSAQPILNKTAFGKLEITLPRKNEQRAIAYILGSLDDKIELNRQMNETLEAIARAIFKSWFVDFDPVRAKAEGRDNGLPSHIADLFPDSFEDSELGVIPKGWKVGPVGDNFNITMGQSPPGNTYNEIGEGLPFFQGRTDFGWRFPDRRVYCNAPTRLAKPGDTLVSVRAPVGDINMATEECCIGRGLSAIRHKSGRRSYTFYQITALKSAFESFEAGGTVFGCMNKTDFHGIKYVVASNKSMSQFENIVETIDQSIEINEMQSRRLSAIRDALLPKLLSGEIRVKNIEKYSEGNHA